MSAHCAGPSHTPTYSVQVVEDILAKLAAMDRAIPAESAASGVLAPTAREALALERSLPIDAYDDTRFETHTPDEWLSAGSITKGERRGVRGRAFRARRFSGKAAVAAGAEAAASFCGDGVWLPCTVLSYDESARTCVGSEAPAAPQDPRQD